MRTRRTSWRRTKTALLVLATLALSACGSDDTGGEAGAWIQGQPQWRALTGDALETHAAGFALKFRAPCRARFRFSVGDELPAESPWRRFAAETVHVLWTLQTDAPTGSEDLPSPEDESAGRTEPHAVTLGYQFGNSFVWQRRHVTWTRPGRGRSLRAQAAPPGAYEPFDATEPLELAAAVVTDLARGEARLLPREPRSRLVLPADTDPEDRHTAVRLELLVEPLRGAHD